MAMMSGRVLLVCALCVLWCGAGGGDADEDMVVTWYNEYNKTCKANSTKEGKLDESAFNSCMHARMKEVCEAYYEMSTTPRSPEAERICNEYTGDPEKAVESLTPHTKTSHDAEKSVAAPTLETSKGDAAGMESSPEVPAGDSPANKTEVRQSTSAAVDTANSEAEKNDEVVMPTNAPESNATGKREEKEGEKKDSNTNETTLEADAVKNITTLGENDGSTAVTHTTSPLLLLLVACVAAAAVVAV
ncbi:mucin-associated surface protein (MASP), putative [Trypanosoma cruzi marinkellei]|uniref:Mucin-associated surface protein (MASP), putative n=1 Tax=Trypanosoma cruzi marinkellei TaxID=85056 RepID=K2MPD4_TRYCR|nr:mucin-associated surface protein (MASP), putative [Trypanosoma cruzi marinkellei]